ncbi:MAG TPA: M13 family metallopeptidase [Arenimonas sp.]|uniref:M13 family metallopeptidase n=1 Tax=Arenimonas sp. TaxID=1872635 RepID=UPI002C3CDFDB|nr:M13 family metallopeptidase [Arenimonas sp.]HMB55590.1 M13 family metallopeptidase [Arenimonas sp.]
MTSNTLKHLTLALAVAAALGACKKEEAAAPTPVADSQEAPALKIDESKLPPLPHFAAGDLDDSIAICSDLNGHVNGKWIAANPVPADKTTWGNFNMLAERSLAVQHQIIEAASTAKNVAGSNEQKIGDIFKVGMDETKLNADGIAPLKPQLAKIDEIKDAATLSSFLLDSFANGNQYVFDFGPNPDFENAKNTIAFAQEDGLSLPERAYYLEPQYKEIRDGFVSHVEKMLTLAGVDAAAAKTQAQAVLAFETRLAKASLTPIEARDPKNQYNYVKLADADKAAPNFPWSKLLAAEGVTGVDGLSVSQPKFFAEFNKMVADAPAADWQAYLRYQTVKNASGFLSDAFADERFAFYGKQLSGQPEQKPRWKRVLDTINGSMGEALGQVYVKQAFPEESKVAMEKLVDNLREALKARLEKLDWMSPETKAKAIAKWNTFHAKIGYPDKFRDYSALTIDSGKSYYDNALAAGKFENAYQMSKIGKPTDPNDWGMTPQTVNAQYNPQLNDITFPAAILQAPFFDAKADPALNYGGIGAVIGHEMMHGYDDEGSQFDPDGNQKNWWTADDRKKFDARTGKLVAQFDDYVALKDAKGEHHVKGALTLGENIADLGGIAIAYDALQREIAGKTSAPIDGFTPDQRFFLNFATIWRGNIRPEALLVRLNTDPHAPAALRAMGAPSNIDAFATAFQCKAGDTMVRGGDKKVVIW